MRRRFAGALAAALLAALAHADTLVLHDGRFVDGRPIAKTDAGYTISYPDGTIVVPASMVADVFSDSGAPAYEPTTPEEKEMAAKGLAPWKGRWVSKDYRAKLLATAIAGRRTRMEQWKARREWRNHVEVKTKHFIFRHTLPDEIFEPFRDLFETYYDFFTKYWKIRPSAKFGTPVINIYHDEEYFLQRSGAPEGVVGYYSPSDRDLHFFYDRERVKFTIDVMFHEGNHMLAHMVDEKFDYPWWIGEGLAEYFGASEWDPETKTMTIGHLQSARLAVLQSRIEDDQWLKLADLIQADRMGAIEYSWTWSFCHFLLSTEKYAANFRKYFLALANSSSIPKVTRGDIRSVAPEVQLKSLLDYLKVKDIETLQTEWYEYIKHNLSLRRSDLDYESAGWIMDLYGERRKARNMFRKAIENGSRSAFVHYGYGKLVFETNKVEPALESARKALEFDPLHARAWALQGRCLVRRGEKEEGERLLKLAAQIDPDDETLWYEAEMARQESKPSDEGKQGG